ncbi:MAG: serine kinase [Acidobacteriota bacterium]
MTLKEVEKKVGLDVVTMKEYEDRNITGGYASDLLSDVIAHAEEGNIWVTLQTHLNIVAIAAMKGICAIITVNGRKPDDETISRANQEKVTIMVSKLPAFEVVGRLYSLGLRGIK